MILEIKNAHHNLEDKESTQEKIIKKWTVGFHYYNIII